MVANAVNPQKTMNHHAVPGPGHGAIVKPTIIPQALTSDAKPLDGESSKMDLMDDIYIVNQCIMRIFPDRPGALAAAPLFNP